MSGNIYNVGGLIPFDEIISKTNVYDSCLTSDEVQEFRMLYERWIDAIEQNQLYQLRRGEGYFRDQMPVLRDDIPRPDGD